MKDTRDIPWLDSRAFRANTSKFPEAELFKYMGQWIAWSWDGTHILASAPDYQTLEQRLEEQGIDASRVVSEHLPQGDIIGGILSE